MPEFFEVTLIVDDKEQQETITKFFLETLGFYQGKNNIHHNTYSLLSEKEVIVSVLNNTDKDFNEICIDIADYVFHKSEFTKELEQLTRFVHACFEGSKIIAFIVCGYEINGYFLDQVQRIKDIDRDFLSKFPIAYARQSDAMPLIMVNHNAQDIFATFDAIKFNQ